LNIKIKKDNEYQRMRRELCCERDTIISEGYYSCRETGAKNPVLEETL
jgi:hypothetical protein